MGISEIPKDDFCISAFLVIRDEKNPRHVLIGRLNPDANWDHIGALTKDRIQQHKNGWLLPACQFLNGESPNDAAARISREQLGFTYDELHISDPKVYSEVHTPVRHPEKKEHWDLEFVFEGRLDRQKLGQMRTNAWKELDFVDIEKTSKEKIARSHEDILARIK